MNHALIVRRETVPFYSKELSRQPRLEADRALCGDCSSHCKGRTAKNRLALQRSTGSTELRGETPRGTLQDAMRVIVAFVQSQRSDPVCRRLAWSFSRNPSGHPISFQIASAALARNLFQEVLVRHLRGAAHRSQVADRGSSGQGDPFSNTESLLLSTR
jgi:hypothetical protein